MATIEETVYSLLSADATFIALNPAARIKVPGDWQSLSKPYTMHSPVSHRPIHTHQGIADLKEWPNYQVTACALNYSDARAVAERVKVVLAASNDPKFFLRNDVALPYDTDRKVAQIALDFQVFEALSAASDEDEDEVLFDELPGVWDELPGTFDEPLGA
jgi:hypothetical protein